MPRQPDDDLDGCEALLLPLRDSEITRDGPDLERLLEPEDDDAVRSGSR